MRSRLFASLFFFFFIFLFGLFSTSLVHAAEAFSITGTVTNQSSGGIANVAVSATDPGGNTVQSGPVVTAANGSYVLPIGAGTYDIHFVPPSGSGYNTVVQSNYDVVSDQTLSVQLVLTISPHVFSGTVIDSAGNPVAGADIQLKSTTTGQYTEIITDANGQVSQTMDGAQYTIRVFGNGLPGLPNFLLSGFGTQFNADLRFSDQNRTYQLPAVATLTLVGQDVTGNPVPNVPATASNVSGSANASATGVTDANGTFSAVLWKAAVGNAACITFSTGKVCSPSTTTLANGDTTVTLIQPQVITPHIFTGTVIDVNGNPVEGVEVQLKSSGGVYTSFFTDATGQASGTVAGDQYTIRVFGHNLSGLPEFTLTGFGTQFNADLRYNDQSRTYQLPEVATLTLIGQDADGNPVPNVPATANNIVGSANASATGVTDASGIFDAVLWKAAVGTAACITFSTGKVCSPSTTTLVNGDATVTLIQPQVIAPHVFSATLLDADSNPVANAIVQLKSTTTGQYTAFTTDANGQVSQTVGGDQYTIRIFGNGLSGLPNFLLSGFGTQYNADLRYNDQNRNYQLPAVATLRMIAKDVDGNPVAGLTATAANTVDVANATATGVTDASGIFDAVLWKAAVGTAACITFSTGKVCSPGTTTLANGDVTLIFQQQPIITVTLTPTPTDTPTPTPEPNVAPVVGVITAPTASVIVNTTINASANFTDGNPQDTHTAVFDWGDGLTSTGNVTESNGSGSVSGSHVYIATGVYKITLTVTDNQNGSGTAVFKYISVYNPTSQGLFTAVNHFQSPAGAYPANPSLSGQVKFGVSAKYQNGQPTGAVHMDFDPANLSFVSTSMSVLVTASGKATLYGTGTINGSGNYNLLVTGLETNKTIRFQITDSSNNVIYDSQPGAEVTDDPTSSVTGTVIIH